MINLFKNNIISMELRKTTSFLEQKALNNNLQTKLSSLTASKDGDILKIQPQQIWFKDVTPQKQYSIQLQIRNKTSEIVKLKVYGPKLDVFELDNDQKTNTLSMGLSKKIRVRFTCKDNTDYYDELKIICEKKTYIVPIKATRAFYNIKYDTIIEGGIVALNNKHRFSVTMVNQGPLSRVKIIKESQQSMTISPDQFIIEEGHQQEISMIVIPNAPGTYRHKLLVEVNGHMSEPINVIFSATEFKFSLTTQEGKGINQLDLGYCFYGQKKATTVIAINNTPEKILLKSKIRLGWKFNQSALQSPQQLGIQCSSTIIDVSPASLQLGPFSKTPLTLVSQYEVNPQINAKVQNFARKDESGRKNIEVTAPIIHALKMADNQFHQTLIAEFGDKKMYCSLKVTCGYPLIKIQPVSLSFGEVVLKKTFAKKLKVKNIKQNLSVKVNFPKAFAFEIIPSNAIIQPNSDKDFEVFLTPVSYGTFNTSITCYLCGLFKIEVPVSYYLSAQGRSQSVSTHSHSQPILKQVSLISLLNKNSNTLAQNRYHHRSQANFKIKSNIYTKNSVSQSLSKDNAIESSSEIFNNQKCLLFQSNETDEQLISGGSKSFKLPKKKDTLFVTRKIDKYQPYKTLNAKFKVETREVIGPTKKIPKSRKEHMEICKQLSIEALKNVNVPQKIINFGKVFVHSKIVKQFQIVNNNDFSIQIKLTPTHDFLSQTDTQAQLLAGKTRSRFKVVLIPKQCGQFQSLIDYTINSVHHFRFLVQAEIELVTLSLSKFNLKLNYQDDANDMFLSDSFELTNQGNTEAQFSIQSNNSQFLSVQPRSGVLSSGQTMPIMVVYNSANSQNIPAGEPKNLKDYNKPTTLNIDERITVKVKNGVDMYLRVQSNISQPKCYVKQSRINFGCCMVPKSKSKSFILRNLGRSVCLYEIDNTGCENLLQFDAMKGKVLPESSKQIVVTYKSNTIHEVNMQFRVVIRGGLIINVPFHAESVAPKISILQNSFNFGQVCCGSTGILPINVRNDSELMVQLLIDLLNRQQRGVQYLDISFESLQKEEKALAERSSSQSIVHKIKIQAKSTFKFFLLFQPSVPGFYEFQLPIFIQNFIKNDMISKVVTCYAKQPKFFLEPSVIKFKKKIINDKDNACFHPLVQFVTLKNPSDFVLKWKIQLPKLQNGKKLPFEVENRKGEVKAKSWQTINIAFNPYQQGSYVYKFPVLIYNWQKNQYVQQAQIKVQGEGQYPILLFDRRQLILPVVPLQVQSVGMFKIINEGYETIDIKHRICSFDELLLIPDISLFYPQGSKMGINKKQLYVIVKFIAKKPVSFTVKLQIYDGCRIYELPISGTSDNSIFSIFPYLSDKQNLYKFQALNQIINLKSIDTRSIIDKLHNHYDQVTQADYALPCEIIRRWINTILKDEKVIRFPQDIVNNNENLLKFLFKITNKKDLQKISPQGDTPEKFYEWIIRILKSMGCLLNHIRPYFLLGKTDFLAIFQNPSLRHMLDTYKKYYPVIHLQSWIILFYQVVSNFWYNPQKVKTNDLKSNIYSSNQIQVLKWIKQIYSQYNEGDDRKFMDLNKDFKDCFAPIYALYHYNFMNKHQSLEGLNKHAVSNSDYATNVRMLYSMMAKANLIPLVSEDEYQYIRQKEVFMLLYQLFESLPQQLPKTAPIIFTCELGERCTKYIEIKNPSPKYINYWIRIEGSPDYYPEDKQFIRIQPKGVYRLGIQFRSRVSQEEVAYLVLFNKKQPDNNSGIGCSLVFELRSQIVGRKSIKKLQNLRCPMYQSISLKIPVENTFNDKEFGNFKIILSEEIVETKQNPKICNFYVQTDTLKIRRNSNGFIELFYSPMLLRAVRCFIIFCDPAVGEFQYEITGVPEIPKPLQEIKIQNPIYINTTQTIQLSLPMYNNFMIKALTMMSQKWQTMKAVNRNTNRPGDMITNVGDDDKQQMNFKVEVNMDPKILQFIKFPSELTIYHRKKNKTDIRNKLKIECNFNIIIKDLILDLVLLSNDKRDVRRFRSQVTVTSQPMISNLVMRTNARTPLVQEIPFENTSNKDWKINCMITDMQTNEFSLKDSQVCLQKDYICKKDCKISSYFVYSPDWISQSSCKLKITNLITNEQIIYNIKGITEQPLSDDHIYFSTVTGKSNLHSIQIKNPYNQRLTYRVCTDLMEIECSPQITLEPNEKISFNIIISVNSPGIIIGYIKFVDKLGRYFWYSITIQSQDQIVYEEKIKFESVLDREIEKVLQFKNSLSKTASYKVDFDCEYLLGQKSFDIKPYSSYLYRLKFKPTQVINEQSTIRIFCPQKGAHIYKIHMISHEHYKRQLMPLKVEVGRSSFREVKLSQVTTLQNFNYTLSNSNFYLQYSEPDNDGQLTVRIYYKPVAEDSETCIIKLTYNFNQTKVYEIQGIGIAPFTVETVEFQSTDLNPVLEIIKFKNPYHKNSSLQTGQVFSCFIQKNQMNFFSFVGHGQRWQSKINDVLAIPIQFKPTQEGYFESMLTVQTQHYKWQYLLKGSCVNEMNKNHFDQEIKCKIRSEAIKVLTMEIPEFLKQQGLKPNRIEVHHLDPKILSLIRSWLKLKIESNENKQDNKSTIYLRFKPNKPIKEIVTFSLFSSIQQSVKFNKKVKLISEPPQPDQKVTIEVDSIKTHIFKIPVKLDNPISQQTLARMEKGQYFQSKILGDTVQLKFTPNNCTFKNNAYFDLLIVQSDQQYRSFKIEVKLKNKANIQKIPKNQPL